ncbi:MAG: MFS transporter [Gammaproteobacteria bacterium]|nr:MFS transporter [Gammaproteobacteria bacterium]
MFQWPLLPKRDQYINKPNLLDSRKGRLIAFGTLYISEGIPFGFSSTAMVMFMRLQGLSIEQVGAFVAAVLLPWGFKWAWAPVVDIVKLRRFGGRKAWIVFCTSMMIVTLVSMALVDFEQKYDILIWMVLLNNLFCATQDVAIDSLAVSTLKEDERAAGNGMMFGGQFFGIGLGGGGAIYVSSLLGFNAALVFVSLLMAVLLLFALLFIRDPEAVTREPAAPQAQRVLGAITDFFRQLYIGFVRSGRGPLIGLAFAALPVGAQALAYALLGTLQVDIGLEQASIAQISVFNTVAGALGCLAGGFLGSRFGMKRMIALFYILTAVPTLYLALRIDAVGLAGVSIMAFYACVVAHGFLYGSGFALRPAIIMGMTNPAVAATQFTAYMALGNIAISFGNYWQGIIAERLGYSAALYLDALLIILALLLIPFLRNREPGPGSEVRR